VLFRSVPEVQKLSAQGVKEVVLLGQNVNSYHDTSAEALRDYPEGRYIAAKGFSNMYRSRDGAGARFSDLLEAVADVDPEIRIRFTSPHPKDFPDEVLELIASTPNICKNIHLPAQSGSTNVLKSMRRGYTREAYEELIARVRATIPDITISSDFISGFCGETEEDHLETLSLLRTVQYEQAFMFAYSLREKTHAAYKLEDDVSEAEKLRRLQEVISTFRASMLRNNLAEEGRVHLVLVEGEGRRSTSDAPTLTGRSDGNKRCVIQGSQEASVVDSVEELVDVMSRGGEGAGLARKLMPGDYVVVRVHESKGQTLYCHALAISSLVTFHHAMQKLSRTEKWEHLDWIV